MRVRYVRGPDGAIGILHRRARLLRLILRAAGIYVVADASSCTHDRGACPPPCTGTEHRYSARVLHTHGLMSWSAPCVPIPCPCTRREHCTSYGLLATRDPQAKDQRCEPSRCMPCSLNVARQAGTCQWRSSSNLACLPRSNAPQYMPHIQYAGRVRICPRRTSHSRTACS